MMDIFKACLHFNMYSNVLQSATMPSLEELLAKSVEATIAVLGGHSTCGSSKKAGSFGSSATSGSSLSPSVLYASVPWSQRHQFAATTHAWGRAANTPEAAADLAATATDVFGAAAPGAQAVPTVGDADAAGQGLPQLDIMQGAGQGSDLGDDAGIDLEAASTWYGIHREHMAIRAQAQAYARSRPSASSNSLFDWSRPSETHSRLGMSSSHSHSARRRYSGPLGWLQPDAIVSWLVWLLAPGLLVAYDVMSVSGLFHHCFVFDRDSVSHGSLHEPICVGISLCMPARHALACIHLTMLAWLRPDQCMYPHLSTSLVVPKITCVMLPPPVGLIKPLGGSVRVCGGCTAHGGRVARNVGASHDAI